jgi:hypothetical protein
VLGRAPAVITGVLIADTALVSNTSDGIYSNARSLVNLTLQGVTASFNGLLGGYRRGIFLQNSGGTRENIVIQDGVSNHNGLVGIDVNLGAVDGLTITHNVVRDNGDSGIGVYHPTRAWVYSNTVTNNGRFGIEIKNLAGDGTLSGPNHIVVMDNVVARDVPTTDSRDHGGIVVIRRDVLGAAPDQPAGVVILGNTVSGYARAPSGSIGDGIDIAVAGLTHTIQGNVVFGNDVGIQVQAGNPSNPAGSSDQSAPDDYFNRDNARRVGASLSENGVFANAVGVRAAIGTVTNTLVMRNNVITNNVSAGMMFTGTGSLSATLGGAPANYNAFFNNGPGGNLYISVMLPYTSPNVLAYYNDWSVTALTDIEDTIYHQADDPSLAEVRYYDVVLSDDGSIPMADGVSSATITAALVGLLEPAGHVISFTTNLGALGALTGATDGNGIVTTVITSTVGSTATITGTVSIADNDVSPAPVLVQFSSAAYSVKETAGAATITVTLSAATTTLVTVVYAADDGTAVAGSDYTTVSDALRFDVGQVSRTFNVPILPDAVLEGDETVILTLSNPVNADCGTPCTATLTLVDNALYLPLITRNRTP